MHDVEQRLTKCFCTVFPELSPDEVVKVSPNTTGIWDSLTAVTLVALIEEEFGIQLELNGELENMSFEKIMARIAKAMESEISREIAHG
jgi:acyl carrier protein